MGVAWSMGYGMWVWHVVWGVGVGMACSMGYGVWVWHVVWGVGCGCGM